MYHFHRVVRLIAHLSFVVVLNKRCAYDFSVCLALISRDFEMFCWIFCIIFILFQLYHVTYSYLGARAVVGFDHVPVTGWFKFAHGQCISVAYWRPLLGRRGVGYTPFIRPVPLWWRYNVFCKTRSIRTEFCPCFYWPRSLRWRYKNIEKTIRTDAPWLVLLKERARLIRTGHSPGFHA